MVEKPLVSVIMNCFNGEEFLREAIDSVLAQTYDKWELIFWDNQSTDVSSEIVKSYDDQRIQYFYAPKHTLLYEARNCAIEQSNGELLAFLDVDDWWDSQKLEKQVPAFKDNEVGLVYSNFWIYEKGKVRIFSERNLPSGRIWKQLLDHYTIGLLTAIVRIESLRVIGSFNKKYHIIGDFDAFIRINEIYKSHAIQEPLASNRIHGNNESLKNCLKNYKEIEEWLENYFPERFAVNMKDELKILQQDNYFKLGSHFAEVNEISNAIRYMSKLDRITLQLKILIKLVVPNLNMVARDSNKRKDFMQNIYSKDWHSKRINLGIEQYDKDLIDKITAIINKGTILEVAIGDGFPYSNVLDRKGYKVYGIDISETMVKLVKENLPNIDVKLMDAEDLDFPSGFFDAVYCFRSTWYFTNLLKTIGEMIRVTKKNGSILFDVQNKNHHIHIKKCESDIKKFNHHYLYLLEKFIINLIKITLRPLKYYPCDWSLRRYIIYETASDPNLIADYLNLRDVKYSVYGVIREDSFTLNEIKELADTVNYDRLLYNIIKT